MKQGPVVLCVLDGWGVRADAPDNAITQAATPVWDELWRTCPAALLEASAAHVGLGAGQMGNSEVGHLHLGAGRTVMQTLPRIDKAFQDRTVSQIPDFQKFIADLQKTGGTCHLMGLLSPGGVHAHQNHFVGMLVLLSQAGIPVRVHAFLDGRDTPPRSADGFMSAFLNVCESFPDVQVATIAGRYYAMDRDQRWDRTQSAYDAMVKGQGHACQNAQQAILDAYNAEMGDEFIPPHVIGDYAGMHNGDGLLMMNFRADRARQILSALVDPTFSHFSRMPMTYAAQLGMASYSQQLDTIMTALFPVALLEETLGAVVSAAGKKQLRMAETEKYAHVTFFFNGGREAPYPGESRILVPSPSVATYDLQPEMSAVALTDRLIEALGTQEHDLIVLNYANADMLGHTGIQAASEQAIRTLDACLGKIVAKMREHNGTLVITADHGNAEQMCDGETPHTAHTLNPVPLVIVAPQPLTLTRTRGTLADVAPTLLDLMGLEKPAAMTGESFV